MGIPRPGPHKIIILKYRESQKLAYGYNTIQLPTRIGMP